VKLDEKTDVFGLGRVIWSLIAHQSPDGGVVREVIDMRNSVYMGDNWDLDTEGVLTGQVFTAADHYPPNLKDLFRQCLRRNQVDRPSLDHLRQQIDEYFDRGSAPENLELNLRGLDAHKEWEVGEPLRKRRIGGEDNH
jgi:hypothetical protein